VLIVKPWPKGYNPAKQWACISPPDVTNVIKLLEDALQGVVFGNDKDIVRQATVKCYGLRDLTVVRLTEVDSLSELLWGRTSLTSDRQFTVWVPFRFDSLAIAHDNWAPVPQEVALREPVVLSVLDNSEVFCTQGTGPSARFATLRSLLKTSPTPWGSVGRALEHELYSNMVWTLGGSQSEPHREFWEHHVRVTQKLRQQCAEAILRKKGIDHESTTEEPHQP